MERLGSNVAEIAETKAGIIKQDAIVVSALQPAEAASVIRQRAEAKAEAHHFEGSGFEVLSRTEVARGQVLSISGLAGSYEDLFLPLFGAHQAQNAAVAVAAVEAFLGGGSRPLDIEILRAALADASSPGRLQLLEGDPEVLVDAAHNPGGIAVLRAALEGPFSDRPNIGLVSILNDKDAASMLAELSAVFADIVLTDSGSPRAFKAAELAEQLEELAPHLSYRVEPDLDLAIALAKEIALETDGRVVATGSITLVGEVLRRLEQATENESETQ